MQKKIGVAIVGYGNVGRGVREAVLHAPDMALRGVLSRRKDVVVPGLSKNQIKGYLSQLVQKNRVSIDLDTKQVMMVDVDGNIIEELDSSANCEWEY